MQIEKFDELLNLTLEIGKEDGNYTERRVGYDKESKMWELVVKYHGSLETLVQRGIKVEELLSGYAILTVPEESIFYIGMLPEIEYVELPRKYYTQQVFPKQSIAGHFVKNMDPFLSGEGVILAILDSGLEVQRREFRLENGESRVLGYLDLTQDGKVYEREEINEYLQQNNEHFLWDLSGHGTAVTGVAGASYIAGAIGEQPYEGIASKAELLIVRLSDGRENGFAKTTDIMRGVVFAVKEAEEYGMPLVINLSYGSNYGPHDGSSLLENFLNQVCERGKVAICVGCGNEGEGRGHFHARLKKSEEIVIPFGVGEYEKQLSIQLWKKYGDNCYIELESPGGMRIAITRERFGEGGSAGIGRDKLVCYYGMPLPYQIHQEIYFEINALENYISNGIWNLHLYGGEVIDGEIDLYMGIARNKDTGFLNYFPEKTITNPGFSKRVITVAAYDYELKAYADFSGRGDGSCISEKHSKPDVAAPGVNIWAPNRRMGYGLFTGTSFATPIVSGVAALLMEWGIVKKNDPYLYGEKLKAILMIYTEKLNNMLCRPDEKVGYGGIMLKTMKIQSEL